MRHNGHVIQAGVRCSTVPGIALALVLAGCGGAPSAGGLIGSESVGRPSDAPEPTAAAAIPAAAAQPDVTSPSSGSTPGPQPSVPGSYSLLILNNSNVVHRDGAALAPTHGAGYQTLRAVVYQRGQPRSRSPVAGVKPYCPTPTTCEYLPPRQNGRPEKYTITLDDDSVAVLSASDELVTIRAKQLALDKPLKVTVTLTMPGEQAVTRQIIYGPAKG
jgi:hypothetical protein